MAKTKHSEAYEFADAILSGRGVPVIKAGELRGKSVIAEILESFPQLTRVELKMCELCPRIFAREVGKHDRYCSECRQRRTVVGPFKGNLLRFFERRGKRTSAPYHHGCKAAERDRVPAYETR